MSGFLQKGTGFAKDKKGLNPGVYDFQRWF